jgi:hypothetical protein
MVDRGDYEEEIKAGRKRDFYSLEQSPEAAAEDLGLTMFEADDWTLQVDLDSDTAREEFEARALQTIYEAKEHGHEKDIPWESDVLDRLYTRSKSGNCHVYLRLLRAHPVMERIAMQATLGSDSRREYFAMLRAKLSLRDAAVVLFETKDEAPRVREWLMRKSSSMAYSADKNGCDDLRPCGAGRRCDNHGDVP